MKVVKILWIDSCASNLNWTIAEDIDVKSMFIKTFGVVVKENEEYIAVAQNYGDDPEQYCNIMTIPKGCIKEVFVIHEDSVCENEQNPTDKVEPKFHEGDRIIYHGTENIYQVVAIIDNQYQLKYGNNYTVQNCADVDRCARFVGHCQRCEEPTEWSEEDKSRIITICTYLQDYARLSGSELRTIRINEYCDWLKSLKPQNTWKPSDEQMEALCKFIDTGNTNATVLESLYNELKELKG